MLHSMTSAHTMQNGYSGICHGFMAINPAFFGDPNEIKAHFSEYLTELRESPKANGATRIYTHGEKEMEAIKKVRENGIPVNENTVKEMIAMAEYLGMDVKAYFGDFKPSDSNFKSSYQNKEQFSLLFQQFHLHLLYLNKLGMHLHWRIL